MLERFQPSQYSHGEGSGELSIDAPACFRLISDQVAIPPRVRTFPIQRANSPNLGPVHMQSLSSPRSASPRSHRPSRVYQISSNQLQFKS